jgi:ParB family chromosome partitioning protein
MDPDTRALAQKLSEKLGTKVRFQHSAKGKGRVVIEYNTLEELDGILAHIR